MKRFLIIIISTLIQLGCTAFGQTEKTETTSIVEYLVNPTQQERKMFEGLTLHQIDEAISLYDSQSLIEQFREVNGEIKDLQSELSDVEQKKNENNTKIKTLRRMIVNQIQLLRMTGEQKNIDRVLYMVGNLIEANPSDLTFMKPYLDVMFQTGEWDECERVLELFEANCHDEYDYARILQNKASVANGRNKIGEALQLYTKAISIYNKYVEKYGWDYEGVATKIMISDNLLSQLYYRIEKEDSCKYYMNEVLKIGDIAARYDSIDGPLGYASACNSIANKLMSYGDSIKADSVYNIAYRFIKQSYDKAPFRNGSTYAFYYMNHARDEMSKGSYEAAVENSEKALEVMTRLYRVFPKWSAVNYFEALRLRAELYTLTNDLESGYNMLKDAEAELEEIEMDSPNSNQIRFYSLYYDFAINKASGENLKEAIAYFEKAKSAVQGLDPRIRDRNVALCDKYIKLFTDAILGNNTTE